MRTLSPLLLIFLVCSPCLSARAQETPTVRVGVAVLNSGNFKVSGMEARDRLVKLLNRRKGDKKSQPELVGIALEASLIGPAMAEAKSKNCDFVLLTQLADLNTTYGLSTSGDMQVPIFHATLGYRLARVIDGAAIATDTLIAEDSTSNYEAVWHALSQLANRMPADARKNPVMANATENAAGPAASAVAPVASLIQIVNAPEYCKWLPSDIPHADALHGACEYAITLPERMPNFVCAQNTARYQGFSRAPVDLISASVRYEDGRESYSDIKVNGRPVSGGVDSNPGLRSTGEFAGNLRAVFNRPNHAQFAYLKEDQAGDRAAWVFTYEIAEQKQPLWVLRAPNSILAPPYSGELWIDEKDGAVMRFRAVAKDKDLPQTFPMKNVELQIDYDRILFGDGTDFVLPVESTLTNIYAGEQTSRNLVQFRDCHKFKATVRIVAADHSGPALTPATGTVPSPASVKKDLEESEAIFAAVSEQALRESEVRREAEQKQMLEAVTAAVLASRPVPDNKQTMPPPQSPPAVPSAAAVSARDAEARLKVSVHIVLVSVVLRDANGHAVGGLGKDNFRLLDDGKPQVITHFSVETAGSGMAAPEAPTETTTTGKSPAVERATAYLFDDVHASLGELAHARDAAGRHLGSLKAGERAAVFTTSGAVVVDFTDDSAKLLAGLRALKPHPIGPASDCPPVSHYMADLIINKSDAEANGVAMAAAADCATKGGFPAPSHVRRLVMTMAIQALDSGNQESKNALTVLANVVRRTESMLGQRSIILVSPGFLAVTPEGEQDMMAIMDGAVRSGIVINTLDVGGLSSAGATGGSGDTLFDNAEAQARGDLMADFASGTGGIFFHNNNNLDEGFRQVAAAPEFVYVLGFAPQKLDGRLHKLKVSLNDTNKLKIQARRGYFAAKPAP